VRYESEAVLISTKPDNLLPQKISSRVFLGKVVQQMQWKEDMIDDLRRNVTVTTEPSFEGSNADSSFLVKYLGSDAISAQKVTSLIAKHFIELELQQSYEHSSAAQEFMKQNLAQLAVRVQKKGDELAHNHEPAARDMIALDHELLVSSYKAWFSKVVDNEMTAGLLESQFRILEAPQSGRAVTLNRAAFAGVGAFAGLMMGGIAVFGLDRRQRRLLASN
jgi:hypothetical protein